ncbi:MAG TPA: right-handed parallel beta-helix repeat-containing protein [Thermoanaerobaculia bacterium]|nr:right-handed parallel beta-helix repeat-containing protein [Thermoanaerobaculia bacterium]
MVRLPKFVAVTLCFAAVALAGTSLSAAEYFVATDGSDSNPGTISQPFKTIAKAAGVVRAGDVVNVRGGVYYGAFTIGSKGTSSARILFRSYPGELAVLDGTGTASDTNLVTLYKTEYVDFANFEVRNVTRIGILGWAAKQTRILGNRVHDTQKGGIYIGYGSFGYSSDITIDSNEVYNTVLENRLLNMSSGWSQTIGISRTNRATVTNNRVYRNYGEAIVFLLSDNGYAASNEVFDNYSVQLYLDNARYSTFDGNLVYTTGDTRYYRGGYPAHGIGMANESYSDKNPLTDNKVVNNIVVNSRYGIYYGNYENGGGLKNTVVANNTLYNATHLMLSISSDSHSNSAVANNIFYQATGNGMASVAGSGITYRNNNWYGGSPGSAAGSGDVIGDPQLVKAGGLTAADYKLRSGSPVYQAGMDRSEVIVDYFRAARSSAYDIGAHELSVGPGSDGSDSDTQAPTAPAGLTATAVSSSAIDLSWSASSDNVGVSGYRIYRNSTHVATVGGTSHSDSSLAASTTYSYYVIAFDAAGNDSPASNTASATTQAAEVITKLAMGVDNIAIAYSGKGPWHHYQPSVRVVDKNGAAVAGATVSGSWSGALSGSDSATTDSSGVATFGNPRTRSTSSVTFTVTGIAHSSYVYDSTLNKETSATAKLSSVQ